MVREERLPGHFAPVFGAVAQALDLSERGGTFGFMFVTLRGLISAAVRLGIVGPLDGQAIGHQLSAFARDVVERHAAADPNQSAQTAPLVELLGMTHDRLYSRLFQS
jgi:urease accessory protein